MTEPMTFASLRARNEYFAQRAYEDPSVAPGRHVLVLTNRCNLACAHCFQDRSNDANAMTLADWLRVIDELPEHSSVTLTGGEPLLFPGFLEIAAALNAKVPFNLITNGLLLTDALLEALISMPNFKVLGISIDGTAPYMKSIRGVQAKPWQKLLTSIERFRAIRQAQGASTVLNIKTVILDQNVDDLLEFHRFAVETLGTDTHDLYFLKGSPIQHADFAYGYDRIFDLPEPPRYLRFAEIEAQLQAIQRYDDEHTFAKTFIHPKLPLGDIRQMNLGRFEPERYRACKFPWSSLHLNHNGDVFPCLSVSIGNMKQQGLQQIYQGEAYRRFKAQIRAQLVPACTGCGWLQARPDTASSPLPFLPEDASTPGIPSEVLV